MEIRRGDVVQNVKVLDLEYRPRPNGLTRANAWVSCCTCGHEYRVRLDNLIRGHGWCRPCNATTVDKSETPAGFEPA